MSEARLVEDRRVTRIAGSYNSVVLLCGREARAQHEGSEHPLQQRLVDSRIRVVVLRVLQGTTEKVDEFEAG